MVGIYENGGRYRPAGVKDGQPVQGYRRLVVHIQIHESAEDYLETILMLKEENGQVRSIDIVGKLN